MCGIGGIVRLPGSKFTDFEMKKLATDLLCELEVRGNKAAGIAVIHSKENSAFVLKAPQSPEQFVRTKEYRQLEVKGADILLLHARQPSHGSVENPNNNHPLTHGDSILIHNGVIWNYRSAEIEFCKGNTRVGETDSEAILLLKEAFQSLPEALAHLQGGLACAVYQKRKLYLYAESTPLVTMFLPKEQLIVFGSTRSILKGSITHYQVQIHFNLFKQIAKTVPQHADYPLEETELITIELRPVVRITTQKVKKQLKEIEFSFKPVGKSFHPGKLDSTIQTNSGLEMHGGGINGQL
jgi:glucosamine 6-phosphate synthetase-like amidotransferase/phosphosugar isomerase protein